MYSYFSGKNYFNQSSYVSYLSKYSIRSYSMGIINYFKDLDRNLVISKIPIEKFIL